VNAANYKGLPAWELKSGQLAALTVPELGGKVVSLRVLPGDRELLVQNPSPIPRRCKAGDTFEDGECAGWDDMFPNIAAGRSRNIELPDHGEVWCRPWDACAEEDALALRIEGDVLPYTLSKRVSLSGSVLRFEYALVNHAESDWDFIWAAHPLFIAEPGMKIRLPEQVSSILNSAAGASLPEHGQRYDWPVAQTPAGPLALNRIPERNSTGYQKYYVDGPMPEGWVELHWPNHTRKLRLSFPPDQVPYLGVWVNEGGWRDQYCVAPEPATAAMDSLEAARQFGMHSSIASGETRCWWLECEVREQVHQEA
jgi:galactose mutarotase-like enzyme